MDSVLDFIDEDEQDIEEYIEEEFKDSNKEQKNEKVVRIDKDNTEEKEIDDLLVKPDFNRDDLDEISKEMYDNIRKADKSGWEKGEGIKCKYEKLIEKLNGIQPGFGLVGAQSNVGKSGFLLEVGYSASEVDEVYSLYFSLDDSYVDLLPRIISADQKIPINAVRLPEKYSDYPNILKRRKEGYKKLYNSADRFKMLDQNFGRTISYIKKTIKKHYNYLQENNIDKKLFVQIDNFHDIDVEGKNFYGDENEKYKYIGKQINELAEQLQIPIWCTAELRKSTNNERPGFESIRASGKIGYMAKLCLMCYNEVGVEGGNADVYYINDDIPGKSPIFEVHFDKNKISSFKGRLYYEFIPQYALYTECSENDIEKYNNKIYS